MKDLLFLAHRIPYPPNKGDKIRSYHILRYLARYYNIHLAAFIDDPVDRKYVPELESICESVKLLPLSPLFARFRSLSGIFKQSALSIPYFYSRELKAWIDELLQRRQVSRVFVYSSPMAQYVMADDANRLRRVVDFVDVDSDKWRQYAEKKPISLSWIYTREARTLQRFERNVALRFDASILVSRQEADLLEQNVPEAGRDIYYLNNGVDYDYFSPDHRYTNPYLEDEDVLVFTGAMDYWANVDAVRWFALEVFPPIRSVIPEVKFAIVGARPGREVLRLGSMPGIHVTGSVTDIRPYLAHARVAVAPLRVARGVQNKVLEAMAMARPVVATSMALEGIIPGKGLELHMADDGQRFADICTGLLTSKKEVSAGNSREWIRENYDWDRNLGTLRNLMEGYVVGSNDICVNTATANQ